MEDLVRANLTRYIGVSNFSPRQLDRLLKDCEIKPYAHEFETHPYLQQQGWVDYHRKKDIKVIAYSPLANMNPTYDDKYPKLDPILSDRFWGELALEKNVTVAQAILGWGIQRGTVVIPKSVHKQRIVENLGALDVKFSDKEMQAIAEQDKRARFNNPSKDWGVELFEGLDDGSNRFFVEEL
jgi:diketogulonate reductase-like aldo/keto reductase